MQKCAVFACWLTGPAGVLFKDYAIRKNICDYVTAGDSENNAVREICELLLGLMGEFDAVISSRTAVDESMQEYIDTRQKVETDNYCINANGSIERDPAQPLENG